MTIKTDYKEDIERPIAVFETNLGIFEAELYAKECPETVDVGREAVKPPGDRAPEERRAQRNGQNGCPHPQCIADELPK